MATIATTRFYDGSSVTFFVAGSRVTVRMPDGEELAGEVVEVPNFTVRTYGIRHACPVTGTVAVFCTPLDAVVSRS